MFGQFFLVFFRSSFSRFADDDADDDAKQVIQEVAAARHALMMCWSAEIGGHAFAVGFKAIGAVVREEDRPVLDSGTISRVSAVVSLLSMAPCFSHSKSIDKFSISVASLSELADLYQNREATDSRDKVYALLGMRSESGMLPGKILTPDYTIAWGELFRQFIDSLPII